MLCVGVDRAEFLVWSQTEKPYIETILKDDSIQNTIVQKTTDYFLYAILPELLGKYHTRKRAIADLQATSTSTKKKNRTMFLTLLF